MQSGEILVKGFSDGVNELEGVKIFVTSDVHVSVVAADRKIFCHLTLADCLDDGFLQSLAEDFELVVVVELGTVEKTTGPSEHGGNGVGGCFTTLLMYSPVASDSSMGGLRFT